jgi:hypothetical protein
MEPHITVGLKTVRMERLSFGQVGPATKLLVGFKRLTREVVPPGNEGLSHDAVENKGRVLPSSRVSHDLIENTPLTP